MENAMNKHRIPILLVVWVIAAWPQAASALTYDIYLYRPADIAGKGISIAVRETKSGTLQCKLTVDKEKMGSPIIGIELSSGTDHSVISMELQTHTTDNSLVAYFTVVLACCSRAERQSSPINRRPINSIPQRVSKILRRWN